MRISSIRVLAALIVCTHMAPAAGFLSVHSPNGIDVWAVGNTGTVFHSIDSGVNWTTFTQGSNTLRAVWTAGSNVWIAGDNGGYYSSSNGGVSWSSATLAGGTSLRAMVFANTQTGWIAGNGGTILKTTNGGVTWSSQTSTTTQHLRALAALDDQVVYAAGAAGTLLKTTNSGTSWTSVAQAGWTKEIFSVSASGQTVYGSGVDGFCYKSTNDGTTWNALNFYTDSQSDVNDVFAISRTEACFVGGGGFIRTTTDEGATFNYGTHQLHAKLNDVFFYSPSNGWACGEKNNVILRTTNGGTTWQLPQGTTVDYQWVQKFTGGSIGNTFCVNGKNKNIIYVVMGSTIYMSGDRGETWSSTASISTGGSTWSFYVSPKDTNIWIAATSGGGDGVRRSTNRGVTWTTTILRGFTSYGMPLEMDPDHPDTVIFAADGTSGPNGILYISTDFGATWDTLANTSFRSPCDVMIVPGNSNLWYVGDGVTGSGQAQMWRSTNYGLNWTSIYSSVSSEIPMIAVSRLRNTNAFATAWSSTSVTKSTNAGVSWTSVAATTSSWGTDIAKDDPNVVMYGVYGGSTTYLSTNAGTSFSTSPLTGSNSGMLAYDRATFLAHQAGSGVWKYNITYTVPVSSAQAVAVISPNGGESWSVGSAQNIAWTSLGLSGSVKIELSTNGGATFPTVLFASTANDGVESWTVSGPVSSTARVRISSVADGSVRDSSNGNFSIVQATIALGAPNGGENWSVGSSQAITWSSAGLTGNVKIELSTNGGSTFPTVIAASTPNDGTESWVVVGPPTSNAVVRVSSVGDPSVNDASNGVFSINPGFALLTTLGVYDGGGGDGISESDSLEFGTAPGASTGIDALFGEYELPPLPPSGVFDVRWKLTGTQGIRRDIRDTLGGTHVQEIYIGQLQPGDAGYPFVLRWNGASLPAGTFTIRDQFGGSVFLVNMKQQDSVVISDMEVTQFQIIYDAGNSVSSSAQNGWNIVSLPVTVADRQKSVVFPTSTSSAFAYTSTGYVNRDTLDYGLGYWLKFPSAQTLSVSGTAIATDTIDVIAGWNIIGSISSPVSTGSIVQIPGGIVASPYFSYGVSGYGSATTIDPMKGYWVRASQNGKLVLTGGTAKSLSARPGK